MCLLFCFSHGFFLPATLHMSCHKLVIPQVLLIRIWNDFLSFAESRGNRSYYARVNKLWNESRKRADQQLTHLKIGEKMEKTLEILHKTGAKFCKLHSISVVNFTTFDSLQDFCFPATVRRLGIEATNLIMGCDKFYQFIHKHQRISSLYFDEFFDNMTSEFTSARLTKLLNKENPLKVRVQVGQCVTLEAFCPSNTQQDPPYDLRWVGQCPVSNCQQRLCWGSYAFCRCSKGRIFNGACCATYKRLTPQICLSHSKQHFLKTPDGVEMCDDCFNRQVAIL